MIFIYIIIPTTNIIIFYIFISSEIRSSVHTPQLKIIYFTVLETAEKPAGEADWVMVEPPAVDETNAVKEASTGQEQAILETKDAPVQEATVDTQDAEMKEETTTSATTEATGDAKERKEETDDKNKDAEKKKEEPKVEEIV